MKKDIEVKINTPIGRAVEELLAKAIAEIVITRISKFPIQDRKYMVEKILKDINLEAE